MAADIKDLQRAVFLLDSHFFDEWERFDLSKVLRDIREVCCADTFSRILVWLSAIQDKRTQSMSGSDVTRVLAEMELTKDGTNPEAYEADTTKLIEAIQDAHFGFGVFDESEMYQAVERALRKHGPDITFAQLEAEINPPISKQEVHVRM